MIGTMVRFSFGVGPFRAYSGRRRSGIAPVSRHRFDFPEPIAHRDGKVAPRKDGAYNLIALFALGVVVLVIGAVLTNIIVGVIGMGLLLAAGVIAVCLLVPARRV